MGTTTLLPTTAGESLIHCSLFHTNRTLATGPDACLGSTNLFTDCTSINEVPCPAACPYAVSQVYSACYVHCVESPAECAKINSRVDMQCRPCNIQDCMDCPSPDFCRQCSPGLTKVKTWDGQTRCLWLGKVQIGVKILSVLAMAGLIGFILMLLSLLGIHFFRRRNDERYRRLIRTGTRHRHLCLAEIPTENTSDRGETWRMHFSNSYSVLRLFKIHMPNINVTGVGLVLYGRAVYSYFQLSVLFALGSSLSGSFYSTAEVTEMLQCSATVPYLDALEKMARDTNKEHVTEMGLLLFVAFIQLVLAARRQQKVATSFDSNHPEMKDYALWFEGFPEDATSEEEIEQYLIQDVFKLHGDHKGHASSGQDFSPERSRRRSHGRTRSTLEVCLCRGPGPCGEDHNDDDIEDTPEPLLREQWKGGRVVGVSIAYDFYEHRKAVQELWDSLLVKRSFELATFHHEGHSHHAGKVVAWHSWQSDHGIGASVEHDVALKEEDQERREDQDYYGSEEGSDWDPDEKLTLNSDGEDYEESCDDDDDEEELCWVACSWLREAIRCKRRRTRRLTPAYASGDAASMLSLGSGRTASSSSTSPPDWLRGLKNSGHVVAVFQRDCNTLAQVRMVKQFLRTAPPFRGKHIITVAPMGSDPPSILWENYSKEPESSRAFRWMTLNCGILMCLVLMGAGYTTIFTLMQASSDHTSEPNTTVALLISIASAMGNVVLNSIVWAAANRVGFRLKGDKDAYIFQNYTILVLLNMLFNFWSIIKLNPPAPTEELPSVVHNLYLGKQLAFFVRSSLITFAIYPLLYPSLFLLGRCRILVRHLLRPDEQWGPARRAAEEAMEPPEWYMQYDYAALIVMRASSFLCLFFHGTYAKAVFIVDVLWALATNYVNTFIYLGLSRETYYTSNGLDKAASDLQAIPLFILGGCFGSWVYRSMKSEVDVFEYLHSAVVFLFGTVVAGCYLLVVNFCVNPGEVIRETAKAWTDPPKYEQVEGMYRHNWWNVNPVFVLKAAYHILEHSNAHNAHRKMVPDHRRIPWAVGKGHLQPRARPGQAK